MEQVRSGIELEFSFSRRNTFALASITILLTFFSSIKLQLGLGDAIDRNSPSQVPMDGFLPKSIACGWWHTLSLAEMLT